MITKSINKFTKKSILEIFKIEYPVEEHHNKMLKTLSIGNIDWENYVPSYVAKKNNDEINRQVDNILSDQNNLDYAFFHESCLDFIRKLNTPDFDLKKVRDIKLKHRNIQDVDFKNLKKTEYSSSKTITGRMTVVSGFNILTAPSGLRSCIKSKFKNGKILQIDLISAEPKFALHVSNKSMPNDVYDDIVEKCNMQNLTRIQVKTAVICSLYGQSKKRLANSIPSNMDAGKIISDVKKYFSYDKITRRLGDQYEKNNFKNYFGRPLFTSEKDLILSHYLQSSVADCSVSMFSNFFKNHSDSILPYYVIHDALIFDASECFLNKYRENSVVFLKSKDVKLAAKITEV